MDVSNTIAPVSQSIVAGRQYQRILFITPPNTFTAYTGTKINAGVQHYPLLSYMYLSSYVKRHVPGVQTAVLDLGIEKDPWVLLPKILANFRPDLVATTCTTPMFYEVSLISQIVKAVLGDAATFVVGGIHVTALPIEALTATMADAVVLEEGEVTFREICEGKPFRDILGIAYREDRARKVTESADALVLRVRSGVDAYDIIGMTDDGAGRDIRINQKRVQMTNRQLDELPFADLDLYDIGRYMNPLGLIMRDYPGIQMETSRGCPSRCSFCSADDAYRAMSPERVVAEMEEFRRRGIREVRIIDDQFAVNMKRAMKIAELMLERNLRFAINFANGVRADRLSVELLRTWKRVGLYQTGIGIESGNQAALDSMQKGLKDGANTGRRALEICREAGIEVVGFFMFGAPGDTEASINETLAYAKELSPDYAKVTISTPFPDTRMFADYKHRGLMKLDPRPKWHTYNIHKAEDNYIHPNGLSPELLRRYYNLFYKEYYLMNPGYLWRRLVTSVKNGFLLYDIWYALKTFAPRLVPGDPRSPFHISPLYMYHTLRRKLFGPLPSGQLTWSSQKD